MSESDYSVRGVAPITGTIRWAEDPLYPGRTPVSIQHYEEIEARVLDIEEALNWHKAQKSYDAHPSVNLSESGFLPPELVSDILELQGSINELYELLEKRMPEGVIHMYDGDLANIPSKYLLCDGSGGAPNMVGYYGLGGSSSTKYPLHKSTASTISDIANMFTEANMPKHNHKYQNTWYCENPKYIDNCWETRFGRTYGSSDSDWDNSLAYCDDVTDYEGTNVAGTEFASAEPKYIKVPFIMRKYTHNLTCKLTIRQPANGQLNVDGSKRTTYTVPQGTRVLLALSTPAAYELDLIQVGNEIYNTMPSYVVVDTDMSIICNTKLKQCLVKVNNTSKGATTVKGKKVTSTHFPYNTALTITTTPEAAYNIEGYTIKYKGYSTKLTSIPTSANIAAAVAELSAEVDEEV